MLAPKKVKWRKMQKGRRRGTAWRGATLAFGDYGLQATERAWLTAREIEAARVALTRYIKRGGRVWVRIFPDKPLTKKPAEARMGRWKGSIGPRPSRRCGLRPRSSQYSRSRSNGTTRAVREAPQREWRASRAAKRRDTMALKPSEVRDMSEAELHARELELVDELFH